MNKDVFYDSLYGEVLLPDAIRHLVRLPLVQRLRHIRLSNIDSVAMPGISGLSRFEHVLGVAHLASKTGYTERLSKQQRVCLIAAALLHDWAITAFGHLVEEGFAYAGVNFDHEHKLAELIQNEDGELGGVDLQVFQGRSSGLQAWAEKWAPAEDALKDITDAIEGVGRFGGLVKSDIDLDNIDNVYRMAYHMGLPVDRSTPEAIARSIQGMGKRGEVLFANEALPKILEWQHTRAQVYQRLMPAQPDFAAKIMLLHCAKLACEAKEITPFDWKLTDIQFLSILQESRSPECRDTLVRWEVGEFWVTTPLMWMRGNRPSYDRLAEFSQVLSDQLGQTCFAYAIKDKRSRVCNVHWSDGTSSQLGESPKQWMVGVGTPLRKAFTSEEVSGIRELIKQQFDTTEADVREEDGYEATEDQISLI